MTVASYSGCAYGLQLQSDLPLSGLLSGCEDFPRLVIREGETTVSDSPYFELPNYRCGDGWSWLKTSSVGELLAIDGTELIYQRAVGCDDDALSNYLLGRGLSTILKQGSGIVLAGSAVVWRGKSYLLLGRGAVGKSTMCARLMQAGCALLCDETVYIRLSEDGRALAVPGLSAIKLWPEAMKWLKKSCGETRSIRRNHPKVWYDASESHYNQPVPVGGIFHLKHANPNVPILSELRVNDRLAVLAACSSNSIKPRESERIRSFRLMGSLANVQQFKTLSRNINSTSLNECYTMIYREVMKNRPLERKSV